MNSIERVLAALTFGKAQYGTPDQVPVFPVPLMQGALLYKCTVEQYFAMPAEKIADAQIQINKMFRGIPDGVAGIPNVIEDVTAFGIGLAYHYPNSTPAVDGMLIRDFSDINSLKCPSPHSSRELSKTLEIISTLQARVGREKVVIGACIAPFSLPSMLMGTAKWMRLLYTPDLRRMYFDKIINVCAEFVVNWASMQHQAGAHVVVLADGMASSTMLPRPMFEEWAHPVIKETISRIKGMVAYEPVGVIEPYIDALADIGAVALLIGQEDNIAECKQRLKGKVGIIGNVNNMKMRRWSAARVELQAKIALNQGMPGYGFILANQGPEIPLDVSIPNIDALVSAVEKYGVYETTKLKSRKLALTA